MKKGSILGVDLNEKSCQISYYDENKEEPETMEAAVDNYQIPLILGYYKDRWVYGQEAKRLKEAGEGDIVTHLFRKAVKRKKVRVGEKIHDGVWLLAKFVSLMLKKVCPESVCSYRIIRKAFASICSISQKNCGSMNRRYSTAMHRRYVHICSDV